MQTTHELEHAIGTRVSYEDMANPRSHGTICDYHTTDFGSEYVIAWDSGRISYSDLRQAGWQTRD